MNPNEARQLLQDAIKEVDFIALAGVISALAEGFRWGRYDNNIWRPFYNEVEADLPWLLDNWDKVCEAVQVLKNEA